MTKLRVLRVATCSEDEPRTNVIRSPAESVVLYIGVSENAGNEERELQAVSKASAGRTRVVMVDFLASKTLNGFDLSKDEEVITFSRSLGDAGDGVREMLLAKELEPDFVDLRWDSARKRTFWGGIAWALHEAHATRTRLGHRLRQ